jgi:uridine kinase
MSQGRGTVRAQVLERVADAVPRVPGRRARVAIDGVDGAGKTWFADDVARVLTARGLVVQRLSIDDFLAATTVRYARGRHSPEGYWLDSHDLPRFVRAVTTESASSPASVVVVDGIFLLRGELQDLWDLTVFLDVPLSVAFDRLSRRDGRPADPEARENLRYSQGQRLYLEERTPAKRANLVIDNTDFANPALQRRRGAED